ncbi:Uncharacterized protein HII31_06725 [Pseudocercospora fuligena]|uniref:Uncharacterized protein n=1 Tax=Pseudocercospora fuligena TaxID=685502 RepID=A0A8H6VMA8_9PEZI|nr:Uncharacterized protein HII31_06725 [Pseudocercospora fuligena]
MMLPNLLERLILLHHLPDTIFAAIMSSKDSHLYNQGRSRNLNGGKEISSSTTLSFTSQLSSLISSGSNSTSAKTSSGRSRSKKDDIFSTHNRNAAKRAKRDLEPDNAGTFEQKHTTNGEALDRGIWERSKRKMEEKARLYAAMKRGDIEDADERYAVDFDTKWAEARAEGKEDLSDEDNDVEDAGEEVEYVDEFGRTRKGSKLDAMRARQQSDRKTDSYGAKPAAPSSIVYGDAIQHQAFDLDEPRAAQMEELAKKRDKSLTPPPEEHFDSNKEIRNRGTAFYQFSGDAEQRKQQMENLEQERAQTEKIRKEREGKMAERRAQIEARRKEIQSRNAKRKADDFLADLGAEIGVQHERDKQEAEAAKDTEATQATDMTDRIERAIRQEKDD